MKLSTFALVFVTASGACAEVADPCLVCRDGATAGDDFAPFAADGLNATCAILIKDITDSEAESEACVWGGEEIRSMCCPDTLPENPCIVCPDGITVSDDFVPWASSGATDTCKALIDAAAISYEAGSEICAYYREDYEIYCCPTAAVNPCTICPNGTTTGDDFAPFAELDWNQTCKEYIDYYSQIEKGTETCEFSQYVVGYCCPTIVEKPCIACPGGITSGDDFTPYAEGGVLMTCKEIIDEYRFLDAGNTFCGTNKDWDEALCCPTTPKNPCDICPNGLTAAEEFFPPNDGQTCKENIDTLMLVETDSKACSDWGQFYKVLCCPETSNAAATTASPATTTTLATAASASVASSSSDATSTPATGSSQLTTTVATAVASIEPTPSGGVTVFELRGFTLIISVSALSLIAFV
ncbi:hypothetical protein ACHAXA_010236 [Cyclostephanos tholiformis]|uniref:Uncharacterized protein n=1 Tax=Cyclostephanos tholiformis TaxID=382380 RepID=A0ABD3SFZ2_9STRA